MHSSKANKSISAVMPSLSDRPPGNLSQLKFSQPPTTQHHHGQLYVPRIALLEPHIAGRNDPLNLPTIAASVLLLSSLPSITKATSPPRH